MYKLVIANRNYSSWSLRAWLYLTQSNIPFKEVRISLFTDNWQAKIAKYSPAGRVPVLLDGDIAVWDTLAIFEYLREKYPEAVGWPESARARAQAWSISAELHSGFLALRDELPQNLRVRNKLEQSRLSVSCRQQIARVDEIWADCRKKYGGDGPWLFGEFSIADIMFTPVALRFVSYEIPVSDRAGEFMDAVQGSQNVCEWIRAARAEPESLSFIDNLEPAESSPLTLG
jgi:glutathione S-transferase